MENQECSSNSSAHSWASHIWNPKFAGPLVVSNLLPIAQPSSMKTWSFASNYITPQTTCEQVGTAWMAGWAGGLRAIRLASTDPGIELWIFCPQPLKTPLFPNQHCTRSALQGWAHLLAQPQYQHRFHICSSTITSVIWPPGITASLSPFSRQSTSSLCNGNQSICNSCPHFLNDPWRYVPRWRNSDCALTQRDLPQLRLPQAASGAGPPVRKGERQRSRDLLVPGTGPRDAALTEGSARMLSGLLCSCTEKLLGKQLSTVGIQYVFFG